MRSTSPTRPRAVGEWGRPGERQSDDEGQLASRTAWLAREVPGRPVAQCAAVGRTWRPARRRDDRRLGARVRTRGALRRARRMGMGGTGQRRELGASRTRCRWAYLRRGEGRRGPPSVSGSHVEVSGTIPAPRAMTSLVTCLGSMPSARSASAIRASRTAIGIGSDLRPAVVGAELDQLLVRPPGPSECVGPGRRVCRGARFVLASSGPPTSTAMPCFRCQAQKLQTRSRLVYVKVGGRRRQRPGLRPDDTQSLRRGATPRVPHRGGAVVADSAPRQLWRAQSRP